MKQVLTTVYRLQDLHGFGAYGVSKVPGWFTMAHLQTPPVRDAHPGPISDGLLRWTAGAHIFGFPALDAAHRWLSVRGPDGQTFASWLDESVQLYRLQVTELCAMSAKQCIFPRSAVVTSEVMNDEIARYRKHESTKPNPPNAVSVDPYMA